MNNHDELYKILSDLLGHDDGVEIGDGYHDDCLEDIRKAKQAIQSIIDRAVLEAEKAGHVHAAKALKHQAELLGGTPDYMVKQFDVHIERHSNE